MSQVKTMENLYDLGISLFGNLGLSFISTEQGKVLDQYLFIVYNASKKIGYYIRRFIKQGIDQGLEEDQIKTNINNAIKDLISTIYKTKWEGLYKAISKDYDFLKPLDIKRENSETGKEDKKDNSKSNSSMSSEGNKTVATSFKQTTDRDTKEATNLETNQKVSGDSFVYPFNSTDKSNYDSSQNEGQNVVKGSADDNTTALDETITRNADDNKETSQETGKGTNETSTEGTSSKSNEVKGTSSEVGNSGAKSFSELVQEEYQARLLDLYHVMIKDASRELVGVLF